MTRPNPSNPDFESNDGAGLPCAASSEIPAYVQGELDREAAGCMEAHLSLCAPCATEAADLQQLLAGLQLLEPDPSPSQEFQARFMVQVRQRAIAPFRAIGPTATALLGMLVAVMLISAILDDVSPSTVVDVSSQAPTLLASSGLSVPWPARLTKEIWADRAFLLDSQNADGSWNSEAYGASAHWAVAMTGLALVALATDGAAVQLRPVAEAIDRGVSFLRRAQDTDGRFATPDAGENYNHIIATWGLMAVYEQFPRVEIRTSLSRAYRSQAGTSFSERARFSNQRIGEAILPLAHSWAGEGGKILTTCLRLIENCSTPNRHR